jgi:hypothetical protein
VEEDFVKVAETKDIQTSQMRAVEVNGEKVCLSNVNGKYYAIGNVCCPPVIFLIFASNIALSFIEVVGHFSNT